MSALLFISAIFAFPIGIVAEQISALHCKGIDQPTREGDLVEYLDGQQFLSGKESGRAYP